MVLLIDNYDSFVHNLARYARELGAETRVVRNDGIGLDEIAADPPARIILSPGPCTPAEAGNSTAIVATFGARIPILGVCLGHQSIVAAYGGRIVRAARPVHGKAADVHHSGAGLFAGIPSPFRAGRYHSLVAEPATLPSALEVHARSDDGAVMAVRHREHPVWGVQFHPESVLTEHGHALLANFFAIPAEGA